MKRAVDMESGVEMFHYMPLGVDPLKYFREFTQRCILCEMGVPKKDKEDEDE